MNFTASHFRSVTIGKFLDEKKQKPKREKMKRNALGKVLFDLKSLGNAVYYVLVSGVFFYFECSYIF